MTDMRGWRLSDAIKVLEEEGVVYKISETYAQQPLPDTDSIRVIRQKEMFDVMELTVGYFKTKI